MRLPLALALLVALVVLAAPAPAEELSRDEIAAGWIRLFDGETLFGWMPNNDPEQGGVNWSVRDGIITADRGEPGLLLTSVPWADFELRCEFRLEEGGNSGIFLRTVANPADPATDCYELNICDPHPTFPTGSFVGRALPDSPAQAHDEWHTYHVRAEGKRLVVSLDGDPILDFTDHGKHVRQSGHIGLQKNEGKVEFRRVHLRPLGTQEIFNGDDLAGWREVPGSESQFEVIDGMIHVTGGRGFLETEPTWDDFVLQAEVRTNAPNLNSGIFFRALPGTKEAPSHGYEYQIHFGTRNGDRTMPADFGTGGIYRRMAAREVVGEDNQWNVLTLVAFGPRIATWVNGQQVVDWTDTRRPNPNPREGLRLEAGHISLQGHDPTTDLHFANLRIAEYPNDATPAGTTP